MHEIIITQVPRALVNASSAQTKQASQRYFREQVKFRGVTMPAAERIGKEFFVRIQDRSKEEIFSLCEELFSSGYCEEAIIAANWIEKLHNRYVAKDIDRFRYFIGQYIDNWASCDTFCNHSVGLLLMQYPETVSSLSEWTTSSNRWLRRGAAASLIIPAKKGLFLPEILQIAEQLLTDEEDLVQKGYGWMLKEASRTHQEKVFSFIMEHKSRMPRTALRYSIEKMPEDLRKLAMQK